MIRFGKTIALLTILATAVTVADEAKNEISAGQGAVLETGATKAQLSLDDLRTFTDVFNQVRLNFIEDSDDHTLLNAAIRGMLSELDPHSSYMEPDEYKKMSDNSRGRYSGIGVEVVIRLEVCHAARSDPEIGCYEKGPDFGRGHDTADVVDAEHPFDGPVLVHHRIGLLVAFRHDLENRFERRARQD